MGQPLTYPLQPMATTRIDLTLYSERNYPEGFVKLPTTFVADFDQLVEQAVGRNPAIGFDEVVRTIWRLGSVELAARLRRGWVPKISDLPAPASAVAVGELGQASAQVSERVAQTGLTRERKIVE